MHTYKYLNEAKVKCETKELSVWLNQIIIKKLQRLIQFSIVSIMLIMNNNDLLSYKFVGIQSMCAFYSAKV